MFGELLGGCEGFGTRRADVVFFTCMGAHVCVQVAPVDEALVAQVANVRALPRVYSDMVYQARFFVENLPARLTLMILINFLRFITLRLILN